LRIWIFSKSSCQKRKLGGCLHWSQLFLGNNFDISPPRYNTVVAN